MQRTESMVWYVWKMWQSGRSGLRTAAVAALLAGLLISGSGCAGNSEARIEVPETVSPRVARALKDMQSLVSQAYAAYGRKHLTRMAGILDSINERCDDLQGKNQREAATAEEWGGLSEKQYGDVLASLAAMENQAEYCRDYAKALDRSHLEIGWKAFLVQYNMFRRMVERFGGEVES